MKRLTFLILTAVIAVWGIGRPLSHAGAAHNSFPDILSAERTNQESVTNNRSLLMAANSPAPARAAPNQQNEFYDLLIEGIDRRPHQKTGRSDVIMIVHCEPNHITFFSIPRDSMVQVRDRMDKINHAFAYGGIRLSKFTIERFLKFKIDNYIVMDFETFLKTIEVIKTLTDNGRLIGAENFLINGENLLKWLRFRSLPGGDRRRAQRDQLFMKRVFMYTQDIYVKQPKIFETCMKTGLKLAYMTDLTYEHVTELYETYKSFDLENDLERYVLPGYAQSRLRNGDEPADEECEAKEEIPSIMSNSSLSTEEKERRKKEILASCPKQELISYYVPKYDWSLETYIRYYRSKGLKLNYIEEDTLRK